MAPGARSPSRSAGPRLDREAILRAAERILAADGLAALTMRRVGVELGADPTAIYRHFRNKQELVVELADRAFGRIPRVAPGTPWRDGIRQVALTVREIYVGHPDFAAALVRQDEQTPSLVRITEDVLRLLREAGVPVERLGLAYAVLESFIAGSGLFLATVGADELDEDARAAARRAVALLPADRFPHVVAAAPHLFPAPDDAYEQGIALLLDALSALAVDGEAGSGDG
ncbi:TetR/AcrR family transcriptional regulator [Patulibacter defluvii]|uniref:TetR/AcrR family transcriptional regulator n=1 Tax=Patulibacter defluvii TaxID=3095358 RepID=UPI002A764427|nr:TetR/AcrR family transcriptional regulator [Patulibacter sp. DM4]